MEGSEERYLADLVTLSRSYQEEAKRRSERYQAERAEHERRLKEIDSEHYRAAVDMNAMYRARVAQAARIRMSQAEADGEHTGGIESASKAMDALIGGACHDRFDFNVSTASSRIEQECARREEREALSRGRRGRGSQMVDG